MQTLISLLHILTCFLLIVAVLLQVGKSAGLEKIFGGGGSEQLFSLPSGTAFLRKVTTVLAVIFILTTLSLTILSYKRTTKSVVEKLPVATSKR